MAKIEMNCPACAAPVLPQEYRRMNGFWGLRTVPCTSCGRQLQYHEGLRRRLRIGGHVFRLGLLFVAMWLIVKFTGLVSPAALEAFGVASFAIVLAGILMTASRLSSIRVELVDDP